MSIYGDLHPREDNTAFMTRRAKKSKGRERWTIEKSMEKPRSGRSKKLKIA
jgi:hypothetical protein